MSELWPAFGPKICHRICSSCCAKVPVELSRLKRTSCSLVSHLQSARRSVVVSPITKNISGAAEIIVAVLIVAIVVAQRDSIVIWLRVHVLKGGSITEGL